MAQSPKTLIVDDSHFVRSVLQRLLEEHEIPVVGTASNGKEAIEMVHAQKPDVITMDVEMPEMDGLEAVERIMALRPTPILMLSAHTESGAETTFDALENGAVDVYPKPGGEVSTELSSHGDQLAAMIRSVATADVTHTDTNTESAGDTSGTQTNTYVEHPTVIIGASTGGPQVVESIVSELPAAAELRILIVQHMPATFTSRFADRLDQASDYTIREAEDGLRIGAGTGVVAAGDQHMEIAGYARGRLRLTLTADPPEHGSRPAIDVTMRTAAKQIDDPMVGVILTGMGRDGAAGIQALKSAGAYTIAQDQASSTVDSMPQHAIETGCIDTVAPTQAVPTAIINAITTAEHSP